MSLNLCCSYFILHHCISGIDITENDVEIALRELVGKTSISSDGLAPVVLNNCYFSISLPLYLIFNASLTLGQFLVDWKISEIVSIHKSGPKQDICNYRPICKMLIIPKLFEKIICKKLTPIVNSVLVDAQHGLRSGFSTSTNLALFIPISIGNK